MAAEPLPKTLDEQLAAIRRIKPASKEQAKRRNAEIFRLHRIKQNAEREAADQAAAQRIAASDGADGLAPFTDAVLAALAKSIMTVVGERLEPLKQEIGELKARPVLEDAGVWQERAMYRPGSVVSFRGSAWVAKETNSNARPGKSNVWRLMVKSDQK